MNRFLFSLLLLTLSVSCTNDELPEPTTVECDMAVTYTADIKAIVDNSCAYEGCHVSGFAAGNFTSIETMQGVIGSGAFEKRAVEQRNMPPINIPSGRPELLTEEEMNLIRCWVQNSYAE